MTSLGLSYLQQNNPLLWASGFVYGQHHHSSSVGAQGFTTGAHAASGPPLAAAIATTTQPSYLHNLISLNPLTVPAPHLLSPFLAHQPSPWKSQIVFLDMHHIIFRINFQIYFVSLTSLFSQFTSSFTCQVIFVIITTLSISLLSRHSQWRASSFMHYCCLSVRSSLAKMCMIPKRDFLRN